MEGRAGENERSGGGVLIAATRVDTLLASDRIVRALAPLRLAFGRYAERLPVTVCTRGVRQSGLRVSIGARSSDCRPWLAMTVEEIYPSGDTRGGLPWKTSTLIDEFAPVRQGFGRHGSRPIERHTVSSGKGPTPFRGESRRLSRAGVRASRKVSSTPSMQCCGQQFSPWLAKVITR